MDVYGYQNCELFKGDIPWKEAIKAQIGFYNATKTCHQGHEMDAYCGEVKMYVAFKCAEVKAKFYNL